MDQYSFDQFQKLLHKVDDIISLSQSRLNSKRDPSISQNRANSQTNIPINERIIQIDNNKQYITTKLQQYTQQQYASNSSQENNNSNNKALQPKQQPLKIPPRSTFIHNQLQQENQIKNYQTQRENNYDSTHSSRPPIVISHKRNHYYSNKSSSNNGNISTQFTSEDDNSLDELHLLSQNKENNQNTDNQYHNLNSSFSNNKKDQNNNQNTLFFDQFHTKIRLQYIPQRQGYNYNPGDIRKPLFQQQQNQQQPQKSILQTRPQRSFTGFSHTSTLSSQQNILQNNNARNTQNLLRNQQNQMYTYRHTQQQQVNQNIRYRQDNYTINIGPSQQRQVEYLQRQNSRSYFPSTQNIQNSGSSSNFFQHRHLSNNNQLSQPNILPQQSQQQQPYYGRQVQSRSIHTIQNIQALRK